MNHAMACASRDDYEYIPIVVKAKVAVVHNYTKPTKGLVDTQLDHYCRTYAAQLRALWSGKTAKDHEFGWSPRSVVGRIKDEREGAGQGSFEQTFAEVLNPAALLVRRALVGMEFDPYIVFHVHWLVAAPSKVKFAEAGYKTSTAWQLLKEAHIYLKGRLLLLEADAV